MTATDTVVPFPRRISAPATPAKKATADDCLIDLIASWRVCRAEIALANATFEHRSRFYTRDAENVPTTHHFDGMNNLANAIATGTPESGMTASLLLSMALDLMQAAERDPEGPLAAGPTYELIRIVQAALEANPRVKLKRAKVF